MYQIANDFFCLNISKTGAELEQFYVHDMNILWTRGKLWNSQSPILFPIVGRIKDEYYIYENSKYSLPIHGFLKEQSFEVVVERPNYIKLQHKFNENTLKMYPFKYEFNIIYELIENKVRITLQVKNIDNKKMYFACGLHPGFSYQGLKKLLGEDIQLYFDPLEVKSVSFTPSFVDTVQDKKINPVMNLQELSEELFESKTICYQGLTSILLKGQAKTIKIESQMPYTAFWQSMPENPEFICIEPWQGLPDAQDTNHQLKDKKSIQELNPNETFETYVEISIIEEGKI